MEFEKQLRNHIPNLPFYTIYPISLKSRFAQNVQGHVINTKITYISFVGESNCQLITADDCGLVFSITVSKIHEFDLCHY